MLGLYNNLIGYKTDFRDLKYSGSDSIEQHQEKLKTEDKDWYYRSAAITYKRNSLGHRCKDVSEIDFDNYILTTGCSHTEGVGLELEHTYSHYLANRLNCDYYNLGMGGTGIDIMMHNLTIWLNTYKKPKLLVVQWPVHTRFCRFEFDPYETGVEGMSMLNNGSWSDVDDELRLLAVGEGIHYFKTIEALARIQLDSYKVPMLHVSHSTYPTYSSQLYKFRDDPKFVSFDKHDLARDGHNGIISNEKLAEKLEEKYKKLYTEQI